VERDPTRQTVLDQFNIQVGDIPVLICPWRPGAEDPTTRGGGMFWLNTAIDEDSVYDLMGRGQARRLAAAVYGHPRA